MYKVVSSSPTFGKFSNDPVELLQSNNCELQILEQDITSDENKFAEALKGADALIVGVEKVTSRVLQNADQLKIIAKHGAGVDNIAIKEAQGKNIIVANAPGANRHAVADLVFGLFLSVARQIPAAFSEIKEQKWPRLIGNEIFGKTLGVIGTGRIGKEVIRRARGFNMNVLCYDLYPDKELDQQEQVQYVAFEKLLQQADFITIHTDLNEHSNSLIGKEELKMMKSTAFIVNTARGGIINEEALYHSLQKGEIKGAAMDVFVEEPLTHSPLLELSNFVATPHMAGYTYEALREVGMITARNVINVLEQKAPLYSIE
ncbi:phosphoglycerate dehydrogenase [Alkalihalobacillus sp. BA299]|uniref:phosphoglycerate dehydrogenase n=1 Tax=Alkalihalobacillus sp. BA299 TaxID=2815938 RepID=UPI001AD9F82D|nr:phosphoglycerate dehydrogenase [Alkalihalobacillus sp. BA299]